MLPIPGLNLLPDVDKSKLLTTIGIWILIVFTAYAMFFKEDPNKLNQETVEKLVVAVDKFSLASEKLTQAAEQQREWAQNLEVQIAKQNLLIEQGYQGIYDKYEYDQTDASATLDDIYAKQLLQSAKGDGSGQLRGDENGAGKTGAVQDAIKRAKELSH